MVRTIRQMSLFRIGRTRRNFLRIVGTLVLCTALFGCASGVSPGLSNLSVPLLAHTPMSVSEPLHSLTRRVMWEQYARLPRNSCLYVPWYSVSGHPDDTGHLLSRLIAEALAPQFLRVERAQKVVADEDRITVTRANSLGCDFVVSVRPSIEEPLSSWTADGRRSPIRLGRGPVRLHLQVRDAWHGRVIAVAQLHLWSAIPGKDLSPSKRLPYLFAQVARDLSGS